MPLKSRHTWRPRNIKSTSLNRAEVASLDAKPAIAGLSRAELIRTYKGIAGFFIRFFLNLFLGKCFIPPILHCVKPKAPRAPRKKEENLSAPIPKDNKRKCAFNMALPQCQSKRRMPSFIGRLFICIRGKGK